jgi:two-component system cell cycle response regulator
MPVQEEELMARAKNLIVNKQLLDKVKLQGKHLEKLAMTDQLTSLYNRHFLADVAPRKISEACRHGFAISLIVIDVDYFKLVNDTHGHARGDIVLVEIAKILKNACRKEDIIARVGGEEFVIILSHCGGKDAEIKSGVLCKEIESLNPGNIPVTASFGVAGLAVGKQCDFDELFTVADDAVYKAKAQGRNCVIVGKMQN